VLMVLQRDLGGMDTRPPDAGVDSQPFLTNTFLDGKL
jgi:hypothetical protein